jgi:chromate transporter
MARGTSPPPSVSERHDLLGLAAVFLRLGLTSFGGPAAHIALMRDEFVRRRGWIDDAAYLDMVGASNLIPGPTSSEVAMHVGHRRGGWPGFVIAGLAFILPAVVIVAVLAWIYVEQGSRPEVGAILVGVAPVVVAIIAFAGASVGRAAVRSPLTAIIAGVAVLGSLVGGSEIAVLLGLGVASLLLAEIRRARVVAGVAGSGAAPGSATITAAVAGATVPLVAIFAEFLKIGAVLFGSGYVLVAILRSELVEGLGWITETQLLDAVAVGQATPGPLFSTATFIGYLVGGPPGAVAATVGIFLPAFVAVAISIPILDRLRRSERARAFLDGVNAAVVGLLAVVAVQLARGTLSDGLAIVTAVVAFALLWRGVGTVWLIAAGAAVGLIRLALAPG